MWARITEIFLAGWLAISPFIFQTSAQEMHSNFISAFLIALFALLSYWHPLRKIHLLSLGVALWLWGFGYSTFPLLASPSLENSVAVGFLLSMLAIVPNQTHLPSPSWQKFYQENPQDKPSDSHNQN